MSSRARSCPHCGAPNSNGRFKKMPLWAKVILICVIGGIMLMALAGLAGLGTCAYVGQTVRNTMDEADLKQVQIQLRNYNGLVESYYIKTDPHRMPETLDDMVELGLLREVRPDPWGNDFVYRKNNGLHDFEIISVGPDGKEGTDDDIHLLPN